MPQLDTATFFTLLSWTLSIYLFGYLLIASTALFDFAAKEKIQAHQLACTVSLTTNSK